MTTMIKTMEYLTAWATAGFPSDQTPFTEDWHENYERIKNQHTQFKAMGPEGIRNATAHLFQEASRLPRDDFARVIRRLSLEIFSPFQPSAEENKLLISMLSPESPVPDAWWVTSLPHFSGQLDLTSGTPCIRKWMSTLLKQAWRDEPMLRDQKIMTLLNSDPHAWCLVCEQANLDSTDRKSDDLNPQAIGWWATAIRRFGFDLDHGAKLAAQLYRNTRKHVKMAMLGDDGAVARLIRLADGYLPDELPVDKKDAYYANLPAIGDNANIRSLPSSLRLSDMALCFGTGSDVEALAKHGINWTTYQVELNVKNKSGPYARHEDKTMGAAEMAFATGNPHALDIWDTLGKIGAQPADLHTSRRILLAAARWKGGRPRRVVDAKGALIEMFPADEVAAQTHAAHLVEQWVATTPTLWRRSKAESASIFLTSLLAGNVVLANRALLLTKGEAGKEFMFAGNGFHLLMALPPTPEAQACFSTLVDLGVAHDRVDSKGETPSEVLARQPSEHRTGWLTVADRMEITWLTSSAITPTKVRKKPVHPGSDLQPDTFNANALERRRRAEELAERAAQKRANPDGDLWDTPAIQDKPKRRRTLRN